MPAELPRPLLAAVIEDGLDLFIGYYSGVQPGRNQARELRAEIFGIVGLVETMAQIPDSLLLQLHRLLLIAGISDPFLGLGVMGSEFVDYRTAMKRLEARFKDDDFSESADSIRANYDTAEEEE
jgi:outer membrane protein W